MDISIATIIGILVMTVVVITAIVIVRFFIRLRREAKRAGDRSVWDFLRSPPRSDREKKTSIDLALLGIILCMLGVLFPPFFLGIFPFFFGMRKLIYSWMGLGLVDDPDDER